MYTQNSWPKSRSTILEHSNYYLVGIKGVAMTSLAQCLLDAGKNVYGSDVPEAFVTQDLLEQRGLLTSIDTSFNLSLPEHIDCVVFTSAHGASENPQVIEAINRNLPVFSQAEAIASLANQKIVIGVCGVGGKSTVSAMITWILSKLGHDISYSVGVGSIPGLTATGKWSDTSKYFVVEADEYVTEPQKARTGELHIPRFAYLQPTHLICTGISYDHPDVYIDLNHTQDTYKKFFETILPNGTLIYNAQSSALQDVVNSITKTNSQLSTFAYSTNQSKHSTSNINSITLAPGITQANIQVFDSSHELSLQIPGSYNIENALAALTLTTILGLPLQETAPTMQTFQSTKRRAEYIGEYKGIKMYDDYAHHPKEVTAAMQAFYEWFPQQRTVFAFQPHTYSRTKELYEEFVNAISNQLGKSDNSELIIIDIFASARETADLSISSKQLANSIAQKTHKSNAIHYQPTIKDLESWIKAELKPNDVFITLGAGDIYRVYESLDLK